LPFNNGADGKIDKIPKADQPIGTFPNGRYAFKPLQVGKITFKFNEKDLIDTSQLNFRQTYIYFVKSE
jgi:hypothetical protein